MKQVLQFRRSGQTRVVEVPAPVVPPGGLLVRNEWSLISPGTERMLTEAGGNLGLLNTARKRPDLVRRVVDKARSDGISATVDAVRTRIDVAVPLGYSCAGTVLEVGERAEGFSAGARIACAGAGQANHAEVVGVPMRLATPIPDGVDSADAAFVTVGAIALQGVRVADVRLGEACVVIGLGLVGQLTVQLLKAAGCRVFGIDLDPEKIDLALAIGADAACARSDPRLIERVRDEFSGGRGADAILITAATGASDPIQLAPSLARDRAVVVAVGMIGMDVPRNAYYEKELQLRLSRSYGPGRYDRTYEEDGVDYPIGYVRWTEQRNMAAFLDLVAQGKLQPSRLVTHRFPIAEAEQAYRIVSGEVGEPYLGILIEYPRDETVTPASTRVELAPRPLERATVRLGVVGAGNFARSVLLPRVRQLDVQLRGVATASGPSAQQTGSRFGFVFATTDWQQVVHDDSVDAILVATRHDLHASVAAAALRAGIAVFLEKPMALSESELDAVLDAWRSSGRVLMVGFNRRFAPTYQQLAAAFSGRRGPLVMSYRVNAGVVPRGAWVLDPAQGGGRLIGEACHMVDLMQHLAGAPVELVHTQPLPGIHAEIADDFLLTLTFRDGSIGSLTYASGGDRSLPKERLEVFCGGRAAVLDDFRALELHAGGRRRASGHGLLSAKQDKGHTAEIEAFLDAVHHGKPSPIHPEAAAHVTRVTFAAVESARTGLPVHV
jgi:predicted dehydrogenase/threonine dehydrogenase-like Zn-dependent dehydrogenase